MSEFEHFDLGEPLSTKVSEEARKKPLEAYYDLLDGWSGRKSESSTALQPTAKLPTPGPR